MRSLSIAGARLTALLPVILDRSLATARSRSAVGPVMPDESIHNLQVCPAGDEEYSGKRGRIRSGAGRDQDAQGIATQQQPKTDDHQDVDPDHQGRSDPGR